MIMRHIFPAFLLLLAFYGCEQKKSELVWSHSFYQIGSQSSPRMTDLNQDGILDLIMGAGKAEIADCEQGVFALDGKTGSSLWEVPATAQMVGSASLLDITGDGVEDVFIGGRAGQLKAIDGRDGRLIWEYQFAYEADPILRHAHYNFYNSQLVPDQNGDGLADLLTINGGNWKSKPGVSEDREPGVLMLLDSKSGNILAADTMPDGQESYLSPLCFSQPEQESLSLIFGSGGETFSGHLYLTTLAEFMAQGLKEAKVLLSETDHGFIAPPVLLDVSGDGWLDILAISHAAQVVALDGKDQQVLWKRNFPGYESNTAFAVGRFTGDESPDIFGVVNRGIWPDYDASLQFVLEGKTGEIAFIDSIGCFGLSSGVAYDLTGDGQDELIMSLDVYDCNTSFSEGMIDEISNQLVYLNFQTGKRSTIDEAKGFKNFFSTPWIGDMDQDGYLDIVYCQYFNVSELYRFMGMQVRRISSQVPMREEPIWGAYLGSQGNGQYIP